MQRRIRIFSKTDHRRNKNFFLSILNGLSEGVSKFKKNKQLTDFWNDKSDRETLQKQIDLDTLKNNRTKDLEKYQSLARTVNLKKKIKTLLIFYYFIFLKFSEYEKVVVDDRLEKDKDRRRAEQEKFELLASTKVFLNHDYKYWVISLMFLF